MERTQCVIIQAYDNGSVCIAREEAAEIYGNRRIKFQAGD
jgi:hypothetical protein